MSDIDDDFGAEHAAVIHDAVFARLSGSAVMQKVFKSFRRTPMLALDPKKLPNLSVYFLRDAATADGDANAAEPHFFHNLHIGVAGAIIANDEDESLLLVNRVLAHSSLVLLRDTSFMALIEGCAGIDRKYVFSRVGEQPLSEIQIEYVFTFRSSFPPYVPDDFLSVMVNTKPDGTGDMPITRVFAVNSGDDATVSGDELTPGAWGTEITSGDTDNSGDSDG